MGSGRTWKVRIQGLSLGDELSIIVSCEGGSANGPKITFEDVPCSTSGCASNCRNYVADSGCNRKGNNRRTRSTATQAKEKITVEIGTQTQETDSGEPSAEGQELVHAVSCAVTVFPQGGSEVVRRLRALR